MGNSVVAAIIKMCWSSLVVPPLAMFLARFRHDVRNLQDVPPDLVISVLKTVVGSTLVFDVSAVLVAPMISGLSIHCHMA